jgi:hypothetical protein
MTTQPDPAADQVVEALSAETEATHAWVVKLARFAPNGAFGRELRRRLATLDAARSTAPATEGEPWIGPDGQGRPSMADDLAAVVSKGPREVLTAALLRGPGRYSRSGSQALAERLLLALEDAGYVIGEARP